MGLNALFPIEVVVESATESSSLKQGEKFRAVFDQDSLEISEKIRKESARLGTGICSKKNKPIGIYKDLNGRLRGISEVRPERCFYLYPKTEA
jgi:hypothetical protein